MIFGSLGDRIGRKAVLMITIALMGLSSCLIGALPTAAQAGNLAPALLNALRLAQGLGAGAEQAGATVLMAEMAPPKRRGYYSALPFVGIQAGTLLATCTFLVLTLLPKDVMLGWAWRVPFLGSIILIAVAVWIRMRLKESPVFAKEKQEDHVPPQPIRSLLRHSKRQIAIGIGLRMGENGSSYIYSTLAIAYLVGVVKVSSTIGPIAAATAAAISIFTVPLFGALSDRYGRIPIYRAAAGFMVLFTIPSFYLMSRGNTVLIVITLAAAIGLGVQGMLGPQCAYLPELFGSMHRYTGVAVVREFSAIIAGGIAPLVGAALLAATSNAWWPLAVYAMLLCLITFGTTFVAPDSPGRDLFADQDEPLPDQVSVRPDG